MRRLFTSILVSLLALTGLQAQEPYVLDNGKVRAVFSGGDSFCVEEIVMDGHRIAGKGSSTFWHITCLGPLGETPVFRPKHGKYQGAIMSREGEVSSLTFTWNMRFDYSGKAYPFQAIVSLPDEGDRLYFSLEAKVPEGWWVTETNYPELTLRKPEDAKIITTGGWGVEYPLTAVTKTAIYPTTSCAMQFVMVHNREGALYFGTEDPSGSGKSYQVDGNGALHLSLSVPASEAWTENGHFILPFAANIGHARQGWEYAVNHWYKPYSYTLPWGGEERKIKNRLDSLSPWLQETDGWVRVKTVEDEFAALDKAADLFGPHLSVHWYWWHQIEYDTHYPDYLPARPGFAERVAQIHKKGVHVTPYINGRLWDPQADSYLRDGGPDASARKRDGTLYTEIYGTSGVPNTATCPSSQVWRDKLCTLVDSLQLKYDVDGVYIDQIACTRQCPCWNPNHAHPLGGGGFWRDGYSKILGDIHREHLRPGGMVFSEENGEPYSDMFDMMLMVNSLNFGGYTRILPLFPMVYSDRVVTNAFTYLPETVEAGVPETYRFAFAKALLYGSQPGWVRAFVITDPKYAEEAVFFKNIMDFRGTVHDIVLGGEFIREFIPGGNNPKRKFVKYWEETVVMGAEWKDRDGKPAWILVNTDIKAHVVTLPAGAPVKRVKVPALDAVVVRP